MDYRWGMHLVGALFLGVTLFLGGCGYKNQPVPPQTVVPEAIRDFRYAVDERGVVLDWSYPVSTVKGGQIDSIESFELFRAEVLLKEVCGNCPIPFSAPIEIEGGAVFDGVQRRSGQYASSLLKSGYKYFFKIRSRVSWWASSDDSNVVSFVWFTPAAAPVGLTARPGDETIRVDWQPVDTLIDGSLPALPVLYQLQRSIAGKPFENIGTPTPKTEYLDSQVTLGQTYFYRVQSVLGYEEQFAGGGVSASITAVSADLTPPSVPQNLTVVQVESGVKLFWEQVTSADLKGYRVYRRSANSTEFNLLAEVGTSSVSYLDKDALPGVRYFYVVTSIDMTEPVNESPRSRETTQRYQ